MLEILQFPNEDDPQVFLANFSQSYWDCQSYYVWRSVQALVTICGEGVWQEKVLKADKEALTNRRDQLLKAYIGKKRAGKILPNMELRQRKYAMDVVKREELHKAKKISAGLRKLIAKDIAAGRWAIETELFQLEKHCNRILDFLGTPQVQGLIGALPPKKKKAWRTKAICFHSPEQFLAQTRIGFRYLESCVQPDVWGADRTTPQPLWADRLEPLVREAKPKGCKVGHDLLVWNELFRCTPWFRGEPADFLKNGYSSLSKALGMPIASKRLQGVCKGAADALDSAVKLWRAKQTPVEAEVRRLLLPRIETALSKDNMLSPLMTKPVRKEKTLLSGTTWGGEKVTTSYIDWFALNEGLDKPEELYTDQVSRCLLSLSKSQARILLAIQNRNSPKTQAYFNESCLLSQATSWVGTTSSNAAFAHGLVTKGMKAAKLAKATVSWIKASKAIGMFVMHVSGRVLKRAEKEASAAGNVLQQSGRLGGSASEAGKLAKYGKFFDRVGYGVTFVSVVMGLYTFGDDMCSEENTSVKVSNAIGLGAAMISLIPGLGQGYAMAMLGIGSLTWAYSYFFQASEGTKSARRMGYAGSGENWTSKTIIPGFDFCWVPFDPKKGLSKSGRYAMVIYWESEAKEFTVGFRQAKSLFGKDGLAGDAAILVSGKDGIKFKARDHVLNMKGKKDGCYHVPFATMDKLDVGLYKRIWANPNNVLDVGKWGLPFYPTVTERAKKAHLILPPQSLVMNLQRGKIVMVEPQPRLELVTGTRLKELFKVLPPAQKKMIGDVDYLFRVSCGRTGQIEFRLGGVGLGWFSKNKFITNNGKKATSRSWATLLPGGYGFVFGDAQFRKKLPKSTTTRVHVEFRFDPKSAFVRTRTFPSDYALTTNGAGRITTVRSGVDRKFSIHKNAAGKYEMAIAWDEFEGRFDGGKMLCQLTFCTWEHVIKPSTKHPKRCVERSLELPIYNHRGMIPSKNYRPEILKPLVQEVLKFKKTGANALFCYAEVYLENKWGADRKKWKAPMVQFDVDAEGNIVRSYSK